MVSVNRSTESAHNVMSTPRPRLVVGDRPEAGLATALPTRQSSGVVESSRCKV